MEDLPLLRCIILICGLFSKAKAGNNIPETGFVGKHHPTVVLLIYLGSTSLSCNYVGFQSHIYFYPTHTLCHLIFPLPQGEDGRTSLSSCRTSNNPTGG